MSVYNSSDDEELTLDDAGILAPPAGTLCPEGRIGAVDVLRALEAEVFPESQRKNVRQKGDTTAILGMCLGLTTHWTQGVAVSVQTRNRPQLAALLCAFARQELPGFRFTSIQVNKDYRAAMHADRNNRGISWIIGLGDYEGGRLWIDDGSSTGCAADIRNKWFQFDGNRPHCVLPFRGRRYTLVFFTYSHHKAQTGIPPQDVLRVVRAGFPVPSDLEVPLTTRPANAEDKNRRLERAWQAFHRFEAKVTTYGGVGRQVVQLHEEEHEDTGFRWAAMCPEAPLKHLFVRLQVCRPEAQVTLKLGTLPLLGSDSLRRLGLPSGQRLQVVSSEPAAKRARQCAARNLDAGLP